jgi:hypothetical protein
MSEWIFERLLLKFLMQPETNEQNSPKLLVIRKKKLKKQLK